MDSGVGFLIIVASLIVATISMVCDVVGVFRGRTVESPGSPSLSRRQIVIVVLLLATWVALGFDYYDRHHGGVRSVPGVLTGYGVGGGGGDDCHANIDTAQLLDFRATYRVALICGISDSSVDMLNETRITVSALFNITGERLFVTVPFRKEMGDIYKVKIETGSTLSIWYEVVLIPENVDVASIRRLSDVTKYGGKIWDKKYLE